MPERALPDVFVFVCRNRASNSRNSGGTRLPNQWEQDGVTVLVREVPCCGKVDGQYLFHAFEGGAQGVLVVACPKGECTLTQGNYRADIRIRTVQRLLAEIGLEPERAEMLYCGPDDPVSHLEELIRSRVQGFHSLGESPIRRVGEVDRSSL